MYSETLPDGSAIQVRGTARQVRKVVDQWRILRTVADQLKDTAEPEQHEPDKSGADSSHMHAGYRGYESDVGWYGPNVPVVNAAWKPTPIIGFRPNERIQQ